MENEKLLKETCEIARMIMTQVGMIGLYVSDWVEIPSWLVTMPFALYGLWRIGDAITSALDAD